MAQHQEDQGKFWTLILIENITMVFSTCTAIVSKIGYAFVVNNEIKIHYR